MSTAVQTMTNFMDVMQYYSNDATANGVTVLDDALRSVSYFSNLQDAINNFVADTTSTATYQDTNQRLQNTCGIVLGADYDYTVDTGAVTGANAGGSTVKNAASIVPETSDLTNLSLPTAGSTTTHTYTGADGQTFTFYIKWPASFTKFYDLRGVDTWEAMSAMSDADWESRFVEASSFSTYYADDVTVTGSQIVSGLNTMVKGLYNFWLPEGFKLAYDSFGLDFDGKTIEIEFVGGGGYVAGSQAMTGSDDVYNQTTPSNSISMMINIPVYAVIDPADQNGNTMIEGGVYQCYFDRTIAHELIHAVMFGKGLLKDNLPEFFTEGVAELVHGLDDYDAANTEDIFDLANSYSSLSSAMSLEEGTGTASRYTAGYMFLRYLCQQNLNTNVQIGNSTSAVDFSYDGGIDVISRYKTGDVLKYETDLQSIGWSGDDFILNSSTGSVYIRNARGNIVTLADGNKNPLAYTYVSTLGGEINGSGLSQFEIIVGADELSNTISSGSGGSWLWGGAGSSSDSLIGGSGDDTFFYAYGNGNDTIQNTESNDSVNLLGTTIDQMTAADITDSGVNFKFTDGGSLTVSGQAGSFILAGTTFHADYQNKIWTI